MRAVASSIPPTFPPLGSIRHPAGWTATPAVYAQGHGARIVEGGTNAVRNPRLGDGATGYLKNWGTETSLGAITGDGPLGHSAFLRIITAGINVTEGAFYGAGGQLAVLAGTPYTASAWVRGTGTVRIRANFVSGGGGGVGASTVLDGNWQRLTINATPTATTTAHMSLETGSAQVATIETGAWQFEPGAYATEYLDGDAGAGQSWDGTPHQSASTRQPGRLTFPAGLLAAERGGIVVRWRPHDGDTFPRDRVLLELPTTGGPFELRHLSTGNTLRLTAPSGAYVDHAAPTFAANEQLVIGAGWAPATLSAGINEQWTGAARTPGGETASGQGTFGGGTAGEQANGVIGPVWWFNGPPPDAALRTIVRAPLPPTLEAADPGLHPPRCS